MTDATGLAEATLGLDRFRVLKVEEMASELAVTVETTIARYCRWQRRRRSPIDLLLCP
jgi:hypothetical protein